MRKIYEIFNTLNESGGISYNPVTGEVNPSCGCMVSLPDSERKVYHKNLCPEDIQDYVNLILDKSAKNLYFGAWLDNGFYYLDISENVPDREQALKLGKQREQIAIWDCEEQATVYL